MHGRPWLIGCFILALVSAAQACGDDGSGSRLTVVTFSTSATSVPSGETVRLVWSTTGATEVVVGTVGGALLTETTNAAGTVESDPIVENTTFFVRAQRGTEEVSTTLAVDVQTPSPPSVDNFSATPSMVTRGETVTLSWATAGTDSVDIMTTDDVPVIGDAAATGTAVVVPTRSVTYRLVATAPDGRVASANAMVGVNPPAPVAPGIVGLTATPDVLDPGQRTILGWELVGSTPITIAITNTEGDFIASTTDLVGNRRLSPTASTVYTLRATNDGGTVVGTVPVTVNPPAGARIVAFSTDTSSIAPGENATLSWVVEDATRVLVVGGGETVSDSALLTGSTDVMPSVTTSYTLTAFSPGGNVTATETITVVPELPIIVSVSVSPNPVPANGTTALSWSVMMADEIRVSTGTVTFGASADLMGSLIVPVPEGTTTYQVEAINADGSVTVSASVLGIAPPTIVSFDVTPSTFVDTASVTVSWDVISVSDLTLTANETPVPGFLGVMTSSTTTSRGSLSPRVGPGITTFVLTADSLAGRVIAERAVTGSLPTEIELEPSDSSTVAQSLPLLPTIEIQLDGVIAPGATPETTH